MWKVSCKGCALLLVLVTLAGTGCRERPTALPRHRQVDEFALVDSFDRPVTRGDLTGRVCVVSFFLSSCAASSIAVSSRMAELQRRTREMADVRLVSFSVDPQADLPATLRQYARQYGADSNRWRFVTGPRRDVQGLIKRCLLSEEAAEKARRNQSEPLLEQCDHIAIVDAEGWVRGWFDGTRFGTVPRVMEAVHALRTNAPPAR